MNNPYANYKNQSLSTMTQGELLLKLYDELIKQCRIAEIAIGKSDFVTSNNGVIKAKAIVSTLASSLDMRYPISKELNEFYIFFLQQLSEANVEGNAKIIGDIIPLIKDLRESFDHAEKLNRRNQSAMGGQAV